MSAGVLAEFATEDALSRATEHLRAAGCGEVETYTPSPPGQQGGSVLPLVILLAGLGGAAGTFLLETYATVWSYPMNIGGRPDFSWPAYVPMAFEIGVLSAVAAGVLGFLVAHRLPALYDPVDEADGMRRATRDGFFVAVRGSDDAVVERARGLLSELAPLHRELPVRRGLLALGALLALAACDDMIAQPRKNPYADAAVGPGPVPAQTVQFEERAVPRPPLTDGLLARGQEEFRAFCVPCHGEAGQGDGMVVQRGFSPPPSYHVARLREMPDQHFYDVITQGWGAMYSFAARVRPVDRWAIVAYIRALQRSQDFPAAELTLAEREALR